MCLKARVDICKPSFLKWDAYNVVIDPEIDRNCFQKLPATPTAGWKQRERWIDVRILMLWPDCSLTHVILLATTPILNIQDISVPSVNWNSLLHNLWGSVRLISASENYTLYGLLEATFITYTSNHPLSHVAKPTEKRDTEVEQTLKMHDSVASMNSQTRWSFEMNAQQWSSSISNTPNLTY